MDLVLEQRKGDPPKFHDHTDFIFEGVPGNVFETLQEINETYHEGKWNVERIEKKHIKLTIPDGDEENPDTVVKIKFYKHDGDKLLAHFSRKSGNILKWYETFKTMKSEEGLDYLGSPNVQIEYEA